MKDRELHATAQAIAPVRARMSSLQQRLDEVDLQRDEIVCELNALKIGLQTVIDDIIGSAGLLEVVNACIDNADDSHSGSVNGAPIGSSGRYLKASSASGNNVNGN